MKNKIIIYDDSCPMCKIYTGAFVNWGLIKKNNRMPFSKAIDACVASIDLQKARHHIPLVDANTGEVLYGIQSLCYILATRFPALKGLFLNKYFQLFWKPLYNLISYNRRVIAGSSAPKTGYDCAPDFNLPQRISYIAIATFATTLFSYLIAKHIANLTDLPILGMFVGLSLGWVLSLITMLEQKFKTIVNFLGHISTVSLIGSALMLLALLFSNPVTIAILSIMVMAVMLQQMNLRIKAMQLSMWMVSLWFFFLLASMLFIIQLY